MYQFYLFRKSSVFSAAYSNANVNTRWREYGVKTIILRSQTTIFSRLNLLFYTIWYWICYYKNMSINIYRNKIAKLRVWVIWLHGPLKQSHLTFFFFVFIFWQYWYFGFLKCRLKRYHSTYPYCCRVIPNPHGIWGIHTHRWKHQLSWLQWYKYVQFSYLAFYKHHYVCNIQHIKINLNPLWINQLVT